MFFKRKNKTRRAVITGIGIVSPIGIGISDFWTNLLAGKSGMTHITSFDTSTLPCKIGAEIQDFEPEKFLTKKQIKRLSRASQFSVSAFKMAMSDAMIALDEFDTHRTDVVIGSAASAFEIVEKELFKSFSNGGYKKGKFDPLALVKTFITAPASAIALFADTKGYVTTIASACTSGFASLGIALDRIKNSDSEIVIAGSVDTPLNQTVLNAFCAANFLTIYNENPKESLKPFDSKRTKHALGEGATIFIVEEAMAAQARGARIYAEIKSVTQSAENINEIYMLDKSGLRWSQAIKEALNKANVEFPDYINAHAPSDTLIDKAETDAIKHALGKKSKQIPISSIKGAVAQGFSSAGGFQVAAGALSIHEKTIPPTINFLSPDPECDLKYISKTKRNQSLKTVLLNSHGLGGLNSSLVLKRFAI